MEHPESRGRRRVLHWFLGTSVGALCVWIIYPVLRYLTPPSIPEASAAKWRRVHNEPEPVEKGFKILRFGAEPVILFRVLGDGVLAFSATCRHLACIVDSGSAKTASGATVTAESMTSTGGTFGPAAPAADAPQGQRGGQGPGSAGKIVVRGAEGAMIAKVIALARRPAPRRGFATLGSDKTVPRHR